VHFAGGAFAAVAACAAPAAATFTFLATAPATLRLVGEAALGVPGLVFSRVDEVLSTIDATDGLVLERH
jgi:hypothetical protein